MGQISREQREQAKQSVGSLSSLLLSNYVSSTAPFHLCSQLLSNTWPPYAFFVTPQKNRWRPETSAKKNMYTDISDVQVQGLNSSPTTIIANYLWSSYFHMCVLFPCFVPHSCLLTFCCFICLFLQPKTFQLHCHWRCQYFSNTSKGRVCGAADNALYPQAPASFSRAPAPPLNWQVWPLLCLVEDFYFAPHVALFPSLWIFVSSCPRQYTWIVLSPCNIVMHLGKLNYGWALRILKTHTIY